MSIEIFKRGSFLKRKRFSGFFLFLTGFIAMFHVPSLFSKIIVLAGTSCSGKTSVCRELVKVLENSKSVHFDDYFSPDEKDPSAGGFNPLVVAEQLVIEEALRLGAQGKTVICDTIMRGDVGRALHEKAFEELGVSFVLIYCPFQELGSRVKSRNLAALKSGNLADYRDLEYVQWLFSSYYQPEQDESKSIDSLSRKDVCNLVGDVCENSFLKTQLDGKALQQVILERMYLKDQESVRFKPAVLYDLIVDNGPERTPQDCALDIKRFLSSALP